MSQRLILIRHGLTYWNDLFRYQGHTDIQLNEEGIVQAEAVKRRLLSCRFAAIYSSDLSRAVQTAQIVGGPHKLIVSVRAELREINFGVWEGLTYQDLELHYPELLQTWLEAPHLLAVPGGETFSAVQERALACLHDIIKEQPYGNIAVVSHGGTIAALICGLLNEPISNMWKYRQKNASITIFKRENNNFCLETVNDVTHLAVNE